MAVNFKSRTFQVPGLIFLFLAFILLFIVSLSLPYLTDLDFVRVHFKDVLPTIGNDTEGITAIRFGTWAACWYQENGDRICNTNHGGYSTTLYDVQRVSSETIAASWTRGLAIHPIAAAVTVVALGLSFLTHASARLAAALTAFLAAFLTLLAFLADIALYGWVKQRVSKLNGVGSNTATGPGFWITFVVLILLSLAGCTSCVGRRRDRLDDAQKYPYNWKNRSAPGAPRRVPPAPTPTRAPGTHRVPPAFGSTRAVPPTPTPGSRPAIGAPIIPRETQSEIEREKEKEAEAEKEREAWMELELEEKEKEEAEAEMRMVQVPPQLPPRSASTKRPVPPPPPGLGLGVRTE